MSLKIKNPLLNIQLGSRVYGSSNKFDISVLEGNISKMISQEESTFIMSGSSNCVYTDRMNFGSVGLSGSYGISGVSKYEGALSSYVGNTSATDIKSVGINFTAFSLGGIEYIDFENLNISEFLTSLNKGCKDSAMKVLQCYNNIVEKTKELGLDLIEAFKSSQYPELDNLINEWINSSNNFTKNYGNGIVVGVAWGAFGGVTLKINSKSTHDTWKYGGEVDFSYAGVDKSFALKALYDHSNTDKDSKVEVTCDQFCSGSVLKDQIEKWFNDVSSKGQNEIWDVKVRDLAPDMNIKTGAPKIPEFVTPQPSQVTIDEVKKLNNLDGLDNMAKIKGYLEAKEKVKDLTVDKYLEEINKPADVKKLDNTTESIENNNIDAIPTDSSKTIKNTSLNITDYENILDKIQSNFKVESNNIQSKSPDGYVPLSIWISNWADIIPWLAQAYYNDIEGNIEGLKLRVLIQDLQTLSKLYYQAYSCGITQLKRKNRSLPTLSTLAIANEFSNTVSNIQEKIDNSSEVLKIYNNMSDDNKCIHEFWNKNFFLRDSELGFGLIKDNNKTIDDKKSYTSDTQTYNLSNINFSGKNYSAFSRFLKVLPLITPDKEIIVFGPEKGGLTSVYDSEINFSKYGPIKFLTFECDIDKKVLRHENLKIELHPIPFSASKNIDWKGTSSSVNVKSDKILQESLLNLRKEVENLNSWSFSSSNWKNNWKPQDTYNQNNIKKYYIGLLDEIPNIFN